MVGGHGRRANDKLGWAWSNKVFVSALKLQNRAGSGTFMCYRERGGTATATSDVDSSDRRKDDNGTDATRTTTAVSGTRLILYEPLPCEVAAKTKWCVAVSKKHLSCRSTSLIKVSQENRRRSHVTFLVRTFWTHPYACVLKS